MLNTVGERLKKARKHAKMTQVDLAKAVDAKQGAISDLENGRNHSSTKLIQMALCTGVNPEWLSTGKGEMLNTEQRSGVSAKNSETILCPVYSYEELKKITRGEQVKGDVFEPVNATNNEQLYWLIIHEDSMQPIFKPKHLVLIDPALAPSSGDYVIARDDNEQVLFRKWRDCGIDDKSGHRYSQLVALNPDYPPLDSRFTEFVVCGVATEHRIKLK